jgi:radical SAM protein with 4Fe4S-binding SPASM domain
MMQYNLTELKIEITHSCPLGCVHCSSGADSSNQLSIDKNKCFNIVNEAVGMGVKSLVFSGGEPLISPYIKELVAYVNSKNIPVTLYTSGNLYDGDASALLTELVSIGLSKAVFSIYSDNEIDHNRVTRTTNSFSNTLKSINAVINSGAEAEIHFVALSTNYQKIPALVELAQKIGVKTISILRFVPQGRGLLIKQKETLSQRQNIGLKNIIKDIRQSGFNIRTGSPLNFLFLNKNPKCLAAHDRMIVAPDLRIYPCDAFKQIRAESLVSDITTSDLNCCSLNDCWVLSAYLNLIRTDNISNNKCKTCKMFSECNSGCLAQKILHNGKIMDVEDPNCILGGAI